MPQIYSNVNFLRTLTDVMTQKDPTRRPTSEEALKLFEGLVEGVPPYKLQWRLQEHNASRMSVLLRDVGSVKDICFTAIRGILCISQLACVSQELSLSTAVK